MTPKINRSTTMKVSTFTPLRATSVNKRNINNNALTARLNKVNNGQATVKILNAPPISTLITQQQRQKMPRAPPPKAKGPGLSAIQGPPPKTI